MTLALLLSLVLRTLRSRPARSAQRLGLWLAAVFFTFYGPFSAAAPTWPPAAWAAEINADKSFKDLWLSMIGMLVFSLSSIVDNLLRAYPKLSSITQFLVPFLIVFYFIGIVLGMTFFGKLSGTVLAPDQFSIYWKIVYICTMLGVVWELLIVLEVKD